MNGHNLASIRVHNRGAVVRLLHQHGSLSRREMARRSGLDASTITHIVAEFLSAGLVRECRPVRVASSPVRGRREIAIELVPDRALAIGVHVNVETVRIALCNLRAQVLGDRVIARPRGAPAGTLRDIARLIREVLDETGVDRDRVTGVGVGVIAFVDPVAGVVQSAPSLGWGEVAIGAPLANETGLPVRLEHHVRAMALAEQWFGHARQTQNFALVRADSSIGVGLVIDGRLLRGDGAYAGQIAHMVVDEGGPLCTCGRRGCLVTRGSYSAIAAGARELAELHPESHLARNLIENPQTSPDRLVFDLARLGDVLAASLVEETARYIARAMTNVIALLDPKLIVLSAGQAEDEALLLDPIRQFLEAHAPPHRRGMPRMMGSALGGDLPVLGAASLAFERVISEPDWYATTSIHPHH